jgi:hypothetical protein
LVSVASPLVGRAKSQLTCSRRRARRPSTNEHLAPMPAEPSGNGRVLLA